MAAAAPPAPSPPPPPPAGPCCPGSWPNFAVVCSFLERYGALLDLPELPFPDLERVLQPPQEPGDQGELLGSQRMLGRPHRNFLLLENPSPGLLWGQKARLSPPRSDSFPIKPPLL
uniref:Uncharacterized protein n=1 Tax=Pavo cristatus TaxID=9049 RepID=A0A8C9FV09_PAVCR